MKKIIPIGLNLLIFIFIYLLLKWIFRLINPPIGGLTNITFLFLLIFFCVPVSTIVTSYLIKKLQEKD